jgi:competence protein ComEC
MIDMNDGGKLRPDEYQAIKESLFLSAAQISKEEQLLDDPIDWFKARYGRLMHRFILSHPDMDHLSGTRRLLSRNREIEVVNFWDYDHTRTRKESDFPTDAGWLDWQWYMGFHKQYGWDGISWPKRLQPLRGEVNNYWTDDSIEILSPTASLISDCNDCDVYNDASYVLRIGHGPTSHVLVPGDVEDKAWNDMVNTVPWRLRANVVIASHHGRNSGYNDDAFNLIRPEVVIISSDEIPAKDDAIKKYKKRSKVFSTREHGTLTVRMHDQAGLVQIFDRSGTELYWMADTAASLA